MSAIQQLFMGKGAGAAPPPTALEVMLLLNNTSTGPQRYTYDKTTQTFGTRSLLAGGTGSMYEGAFSPDKSVLFTAGNSTPYINAWPWDLATGTAGTKWGNPTPLPGSGGGRGVGITPGAVFVADAAGAPPCIYAYQYTNIGFGAKYADPATPVANGTVIWDVVASPSAASVVIGLQSGGGGFSVLVYQWSDVTGWGATIAGLTDTIGSVSDMKFNAAGDRLFIASSVFPHIRVYEYSDVTGIGAKIADPATLGIGSAKSIAIHPTGTTIVVYGDLSPYVNAWTWSDVTGWGTKYAAPSVDTTGYGFSGCSFNTAGDVLLLSQFATPRGAAYLWSQATGFGTKFANPASATASLDVLAI